MTPLRYTLVADGPTDRVLSYVIRWALVANGVALPIVEDWVDPRDLPGGARALEERITKTVALAPCDILFVHRDAEREPAAARRNEITTALQRAVRDGPLPTVCMVPVRMTEAWFLFDEQALRAGAGNPSGSAVLALPSLRQVERLLDPKATLRELMEQASGLSGRRLRRRRLHIDDVARRIDDFSPLRSLSAFTEFELELRSVLAERQWLT